MNTSIGQFDGPRWEKYCQRLLKLKYGDDGYQEVPARYGGDLGIEGYTQTGIVFQCYCPDGNPSSQELYEKQRNKITADTGKLKKYENELTKLLGDIKIRWWHFLTPSYDSRHLLSHCNQRTSKVLSWGCQHIHSDFRILLRDEDCFIREREVLLGRLDYDISLDAVDVAAADIEDWIADNNALYATLDDKLSKVVTDSGRRNRYSKKNIELYLQGQNMLDDMLASFPEYYQNLMKLKAAKAMKAEHDSLLQIQPPKDFLISVGEEYQEALLSDLGAALAPGMSEILVREAVASWLIECPLDF
jgi:hypothetical protein